MLLCSHACQLYLDRVIETLGEDMLLIWRRSVGISLRWIFVSPSAGAGLGECGGRRDTDTHHSVGRGGSHGEGFSGENK